VLFRSAIVSDNGDFLLTDGNDEKIREVNRLVRTEINGWKIYPGYGTPLHDFAGRPNTQETAQELSKSLELYLNKFVNGIGVLRVRVVPVNEESVDVFVFAYSGGLQVPVSRIVYDYQDGIVKDIKDPAEPIETVVSRGRHAVPTNPYLRKTDL